MVNENASLRAVLRPVQRLVTGYLAVVAASLVALVVLSIAAPREATTEAWVHTVIVVVFALVLQLRLFAVRKGSTRAVRALVIISAVLLVVNVVEAALPELFPVWMRLTMVVIAVLMVALLVTGVRAVRATRTSGPGQDAPA